MKDTSTASPLHYSAFWPLWIALLALLIFHSYQLKRVTDERQQLADNLVQLQAVLPKAQLIQVSMVRVSQDLLGLAQDGNTTAQQIVNEFGIRSTPRGSTPAPAPAK
jgi:hypothetical protein